MTGLLGDDGILVHIGVPKTGTTALQLGIESARGVLAAAGVLYPGPDHNHVPALRSPLGWPATPEDVPRDERRWRDLQEQVRAHEGRVVVSAESLSAADDRQLHAVLDGFGRSHVEMVVTLRPLHRILPSAWQEDVKAGLREPYRDWLRDICRGPHADRATPATFWMVQDHAMVIERWAAAVGAEHVTVVVVDSSDRDAIFRTFDDLIGVARGTLRPGADDRGNRSLTAAESEVLLRLNDRLDSPGAFVARQRQIPPRAIWHLLDGREPGRDERRHLVPPDLVDQIRPISADAVRRIEALGVRVVGELDQLVPGADAGASGYDLDAVDDDVPMDAAVLLIHGLLRL